MRYRLRTLLIFTGTGTSNARRSSSVCPGYREVARNRPSTSGEAIPRTRCFHIAHNGLQPKVPGCGVIYISELIERGELQPLPASE